ncbi:MAG: cobalamin B12-binding domain-containing protein [Peptococcaceae bacterium]|nr:MAG: cobalamin B12-binding domain-containing protein [Peptococcaceae bacterium]
MPVKNIRVLLSKAGLDGHNRGIKVVAQLLREAGMEIVYLGERQLPEKIVRAAIQEDVDVIGISLLSGEHMVFMPEIIDLLKKEGVKENFLLLLGGIIPKEDIRVLKEMGVDEVFTPGSPVEKIVSRIRAGVRK